MKANIILMMTRAIGLILVTKIPMITIIMNRNTLMFTMKMVNLLRQDTIIQRIVPIGAMNKNIGMDKMRLVVPAVRKIAAMTFITKIISVIVMIVI